MSFYLNAKRFVQNDKFISIGINKALSTSTVGDFAINYDFRNYI